MRALAVSVGADGVGKVCMMAYRYLGLLGLRGYITSNATCSLDLVDDSMLELRVYPVPVCHTHHSECAASRPFQLIAGD